jgi:hypothetical protein
MEKVLTEEQINNILNVPEEAIEYFKKTLIIDLEDPVHIMFTEVASIVVFLESSGALNPDFTALTFALLRKIFGIGLIKLH